jgi:hypothetical protein
MMKKKRVSMYLQYPRQPLIIIVLLETHTTFPLPPRKPPFISCVLSAHRNIRIGTGVWVWQTG